jgi:hypothetical protein
MQGTMVTPFSRIIVYYFSSFLMRLQIQRVFLVACAIFQQVLCQEPVRIVAVADLHGDYDNSLAVLQMSDLVDDKAKWKGGNNTIFVQTVWGIHILHVSKHVLVRARSY